MSCSQRGTLAGRAQDQTPSAAAAAEGGSSLCLATCKNFIARMFKQKVSLQTICPTGGPILTCKLERKEKKATAA